MMSLQDSLACCTWCNRRSLLCTAWLCHRNRTLNRVSSRGETSNSKAAQNGWCLHRGCQEVHRVCHEVHRGCQEVHRGYQEVQQAMEANLGDRSRVPHTVVVLDTFAGIAIR